MSDLQQGHPTEDDLLELALGSLSYDAEAAILQHVNRCLPCRGAYDEISRTLDSALPASPVVAPPAGFDARVLDRIGIRGAAPEPASRRVPILVAAAAAVGILVGGVGAVAIHGSDSSTATASKGANALQTSSGGAVGNVLQSRYEGHSVLVMQIKNGPPGMHYSCRLRLKDGSARDAGDWTVPESGNAVWIAPVPSSRVERVELVTDSGQIWSAARIKS